MNRRAIPALDMSRYGQESLQREGFVAVRLADSFSKAPEVQRPHYHHFFQVTLLEGPGRLMHDFREVALSGMTLLFLSPGQVHSVVPGPGLSGTIISFTREFFEISTEAGRGLLLELPFFYGANALPWLSLRGEAGPVMQRLFQDVQDEFDQARPGAPEVLRALLQILLVKASRFYAEFRPSGGSSRRTGLVRQFHWEVEKHFHEWATLSPYARQLGVSVNHLNDLVAEETGRPAGEHIRGRRLLDAKRLLLHSDLSIAEIGYRVGFKDPAYFSRFFRRYEKCSPAECRDRIREKYQQ
jgi:AraC family transcriptional activator of pobA